MLSFLIKTDTSGPDVAAIVAQCFTPVTVGPGDALLGMPGNIPANFAADFPGYVYVIPELDALKVQLNAAKSPLDDINANEKSRAVYRVVSDQARPYYALRHPQRGLLPTKMGAEVVTNAWIKMYEACALLLPKEPRGGKLRSLHLAEAPGNFMLAINHYLAVRMPKVAWTWYANSYRMPYGAKGGYLRDEYGIMSGDLASHWLYGADGDGDITSPANLLSFRQHLEANGGLVDLVTSDVKVVMSDNNFYEEERINVPVTLGHLLGAFLCLRPGGNMLLKEFTKFEAASASILLLATMCFTTLKIIKPLSSRAANSEIYVLGLGYKPMPVDALQALLGKLEYLRELNTAAGGPALLPANALPKTFLASLVAAQRALATSQMEAIAENIVLTKKYANTPPAVISDELFAINRANMKPILAWLEANPIDVLPAERRMRTITASTRGGRGGHRGGRGRHAAASRDK